MGKNKRKHPELDEILERPWCYYCERDFDDLKILINHQKAKHYKCDRCGRRLNTAGGLSVHMTQVHKESLTAIENALPNRAGLDVEIFGMEGVPEDAIQSHRQRILQQFAQAEADRRAQSGNAGPGGAAGDGSKKTKFEAPSDLKKRLAEHKAKKAAEEAAAAAAATTGVTIGVGHGSEQIGANGHSSLPTGPSAVYSNPQSMPPQHSSPFNPIQQAFNAPPGMASYPAPSSFAPAPQSYGGPNMSIQPGFPPNPHPAIPGHLGYQQSHSQGPHGFASFPQSFQTSQPNTHSPMSMPPTAFPPPASSPVGAFPGHPNLPPRPVLQNQHLVTPRAVGVSSAPVVQESNTLSGGVDEQNAAHDDSGIQDTAVAGGTVVKSVEEKKNRKEKEKGLSKLMYSDNEVSPEEKMAQLSRYAFVIAT